MNTRKNSKPELPSEKKFGLLFAGIFAVLAVTSYRHVHMPSMIVAMILSVFFFYGAMRAPKLLAPLNKAWYMLGLLLGKVVSPIVLGALFFLVITPVAFIGRLAGRDVLRLRPRSVDSYWVERAPGPSAESFKQQF